MIKQFLIVIPFVAALGAHAMELVPEPHNNSEELIQQFLGHLKGNTEESKNVLQILAFRALMFECFIGEFLAVERDEDNTKWDQNFAIFEKMESGGYEETQPVTKALLQRLDELVVATGSELSFARLMLIQNARSELLDTRKALNVKRSQFLGQLDSWTSEAIFAPVGPKALKRLARYRSQLDDSELALQIGQLLDECESKMQRIEMILGINGKDSVAEIVDVFTDSRSLKQVYNELYLRIQWQMDDEKGGQVVCPFAIDCLVNPPPCLVEFAKFDKPKLLSCLRNVLFDENIGEVARYTNSVLQTLTKSRDPQRDVLSNLLFHIPRLQPWKIYTFRTGEKSDELPARLRGLLKYYYKQLEGPRSEEEKANDWLVGTVGESKGQKNQPKRKPLTKKEKRAAAAKTAAVRKRVGDTALPVMQEVEQAPDVEPTQITLGLRSPKKKVQWVRNVELLRDVLNHDRVIRENEEHCVFRQNNADGRQAMVVLLNHGDRGHVFDPLEYDVTAFRRKDDTFHTISPILCAHARFGYWVDPSTINNVDGIHRKLEAPIRFNKASQRALVIPAKIIQSPFCDAEMALRDAGIEGAYVFIFDGQTCFHAMFHASDEESI